MKKINVLLLFLACIILSVTAVADNITLTTVAPAGLWQQSGDDIYYDTGNVGIGINAPTDALHVVGNAHVTGNVLIDGQLQSSLNSISHCAAVVLDKDLSGVPTRSKTITVFPSTDSRRIHSISFQFATAGNTTGLAKSTFELSGGVWSRSVIEIDPDCLKFKISFKDSAGDPNSYGGTFNLSPPNFVTIYYVVYYYTIS